MLNDHLNFFFWLCRGLHVFSAVGWIGGVGFLNGVADPIFKYIGSPAEDVQLRLRQRFMGYVWTCVWGLGVSGIILMLASGQFIFFDFSTVWRVLLLLKQLLFLFMIVAALVISRSLKELPAASTEKDQDGLSARETIAWRITMLNKFTMLCGIAAILLAVAM